ncbi:hypothetical protein PIROE2DRAFT_5205 [Piromyces sp. E2]|nr:hypothetical protein PIROE2DRAFT_5205 [Piromyces sp. E2]|eukprot:OUM67345.1 hypothetical protein PIROE2DRAFT_5205 [Piromyces sp. E2]
MKYSITIKLLFIITLIITYCQANFLKDLKDSRIDNANYSKIKSENIVRDIKFNEKRTLDVHYDIGEVNELKPVVIFIYGGTWKKGSKVKYNKIGSYLEENDYVAVLPNYGLFPFAVFEDMVYDVYTAITWTFENIQKYGGDPKKVTLVGHSAGAHLCALTLFKSYYQMENNGEILKPLPEFKKVILLAGPYDIDDYYKLKIFVDDEGNNSLLEQMVKLLLRTKDVSPHDIIKNKPDNSVTDSFNVKKFIFYHTEEDEKVPFCSTEKLIKQMKRVSKDIDLQFIYNNKYLHSEIVNGFRFDVEEQIDLFFSLLEL